MEAVKVLDVKHCVIDTYLKEVEPLEAESKYWVRGVVDPSTADILMNGPKFAKDRIGYAAYLGNKVVGIAIAYTPDAWLDLLHVHPDYRGRGIAQELILAGGCRSVSVNPRNDSAVALYKKLGLEIDYDEV